MRNLSIKPITKNHRGFSLIELLAVVAIIGVLAVATLPSIRGSLDSIQLGGVADTVSAELLLARQTAMSRQLPVELRIYQSDTPHGLKWNMIAALIPALASGRDEDEWVTRGIKFEGNVVFDDNASYSTVISLATPYVPDQVLGPWIAKESATAPHSLRDKDYVAMIFNPDGSTNLKPDNQWCLSLKNATAKPLGDRPAANFITLILDRVSGRAMIYQP